MLDTWIISTLRTGLLAPLHARGKEVVLPLLNALTHPQADVRRHAPAVLRTLAHPDALDELFRLALLGDERAAEWLRTTRHRPGSAGMAAIAGFLKEGAWDPAALGDGYAASDEPLRQRVRDHIRNEQLAPALVGLLHGPDPARRARELDAAAIDLALGTLDHPEVCAALYRLATFLSPARCCQLLLALDTARWRPAQSDEAWTFEALLALARACPAGGPGPGGTLSRYQAVRTPGVKASVVALAPDATLLAAGGRAHTFWVWRLPGKELLWQGDLPASLHQLAFSPDGRYVASVSYATIHVFNAATGALVAEWKGHHRYVERIAIDPSSRYLACTGRDRGELRVWYFPEGSPARALGGQEGAVSVFRFGESGDEVWGLVESERRQVIRWNVRTGEMLERSPVDVAGEVLAIAPHGSALITADGTVWDVRTNQLCHALPGPCLGPHFNPNGDRLVVGSSSGEIRTYRWPDLTGAPPVTAEADGDVFAFATSRTGNTVAAAGWIRRIHVWHSELGDWLDQPVDTIPAGVLTRYQGALEAPDLHPAERAWIQFLVALSTYRSREAAVLGGTKEARSLDVCLGGGRAQEV